ncbi:MAG: hypothetical protein JRI28_07255 [Deltaproteobacteria bacterium]|nr:hypothetical protein [Deltaproteobacteria bacterium]
MKIEIIGSESLGVRSLCCFIETANRKILIDPGVALGFLRHGLHPHPFQVAIGERVRRKIIKRWSQATDIVISHFHGDHTPLAEPNPYQLGLNRLQSLTRQQHIWSKNIQNLSHIEKKRAESLPLMIGKELIPAEEKKDGCIQFSKAVPHGESAKNSLSVMMTRISDGNDVFVHASDIQLLNEEAVAILLEWSPSIVFLSGPPLYLSFFSHHHSKKSWNLAVRLLNHIQLLIIDHHLLRCNDGLKWIRLLKLATKRPVVCAADFMNHPRLMLEARRNRLYEKMPVPENWHDRYALGLVDTDVYWIKGLDQRQHSFTQSSSLTIRHAFNIIFIRLVFKLSYGCFK